MENFPSDDAIKKVIKEAEEDVNIMTYGRIYARGFDTLSAFQQEKVKLAVARQADFRSQYSDLLSNPLSSYSINGVSTVSYTHLDVYKRQGEYYISIDYGTYNPFSAGLWLVTPEGIAYREKEYYYSGRKNALPKTDEEYYADLENFAGDKYIERIIIDPSASSFITCIKRHGRFRVHHANNDVLEGIRNVATAMNTGRLKFSRCV